MNKIKKVGTSFIIFISGMISKVWAIDRPYGMVISEYAVDPGRYAKVQTIGDTISKIAIPIVLFVIGLFVVLSKKITKKVKVTVISVLIVLAILGYVLMNYIATNF